MQTSEKKSTEWLSRLHQELRGLLAHLERSLEVVFGRSPLVKDSVYEIARKCGKPSCVCARGQLHKSMVLSWSDQVQSRLGSVPPRRLEELRRKTEAYRRCRRARAQVAVIGKRDSFETVSVSGICLFAPTYLQSAGNGSVST